MEQRVVFGGIVGNASGYGTNYISNCYNVGETYNNGNRIGGIAGYVSYATYSNCFATTKLIGATYGTVSQSGENLVVSSDKLCDYMEKLGDAFTNDIKDKDENWKYNNGYPILKWQLEK